MNVIGKRWLSERAEKVPDAASALQVWLDVAVESEWHSLADVRLAFPATDMAGDLAIFNLPGNRFRLIVGMAFRYQRAYVQEFLTETEHDQAQYNQAQYNKEKLKKWLSPQNRLTALPIRGSSPAPSHGSLNPGRRISG